MSCCFRSPNKKRVVFTYLSFQHKYVSQTEQGSQKGIERTTNTLLVVGFVDSKKNTELAYCLLFIYISKDFYLYPNTVEANGICGTYSIGQLNLRNLVPKYFSKNGVPVIADNPQKGQ